MIFKNGDYVKCKKWSGATFLGIYEQTYDDGSHCVVDVTNGKRFNVHPNDIEMACEEESTEIKKLSKTNNVKPRANVGKSYATGKAPSTNESDSETLEVDDELEAALEATE